MNRNLLICAAVLSPAVGAQAADVVYKPPQVEEVMVVEQRGFTWTGFYLGAVVGYHWTDVDAGTWRLPEPGFAIDNWAGGGFFGYNYQFESDLVLGLEGEFNYLGGSGDRSTQVIISGVPEAASGAFDLGWSGSLRGRIGYAFGRTMVYATGGGEIVGGKVKGSTALYSIDTSRKMLPGWTVGVGIEQAFSDNLFARLEYRYSDFPKQNKSFSWDPNFSIQANKSVVQVGLGYKF